MKCLVQAGGGHGAILLQQRDQGDCWAHPAAPLVSAYPGDRVGADKKERGPDYSCFRGAPCTCQEKGLSPSPLTARSY